MKHTHLLFIFGLICLPMASDAAPSCSRASLTRCLDSACAIGVSSNPAARCQYCGTADAGTPPDDGMRSVSVGQSSKNTLSAKELKSAPEDPGKRYAWATENCLKKIAGCTTDDVEETYDKLIEQSCKAAGIKSEMTRLAKDATKKASKSECAIKIQSCMIADKKCGADYASCEENADFDKFFATCSVDATGCDEHISGIRTDLLASRDAAIKNADQALAGLVKRYQDERQSALSIARDQCTNNQGHQRCVETVCATNMPHKCDIGYESEKSAATLLCEYIKLACAVLR